MYINSAVFQTKNSVLHIGSINRSIQHQTNQTNPTAQKNNNQDRVTISPQGRMMQMIDQLNKQKETITQRKNELMSQSTENGMDADTIKAMTDVYEQQIKEIDKQISDLYAQQTKEATKQNKKDKPKQKAETKEEAQMQKMNIIVNVSNDVTQMEQISALQEQTEGEIHIQQGEIDTSELRIDNLESKKIINPDINVADLITNEKNAIADKKQNIADLQSKISDLSQTYGDILHETTAELAENNHTQNDNPEHTEETKTEEEYPFLSNT